MKLHIGCGAVYLRGYTNVDLRGPNTFLAQLRPDLVERWGTTEDRYYARHADKTAEKLAGGPLNQSYVCDIYGSFTDLPIADNAVDEVLTRHAFEHLSIAEAHRALDAMDYILKPEGILRIDVPDHLETMRLLLDTKDPFYVRHLLGPRRDDYGFHMMSYTRERLRSLVEEHGFQFVCEEPNIHFYPSICFRFKKVALQPPVEWLRFPEIPADWKVAEVGPGAYPWSRADIYLDNDPDILRKMPIGKNIRLADLNAGMPNVLSAEFDFVFCSHVLEHVDDVRLAAETLARIAKRGIVVMPSFVKEALFNFEEAEHRWIIMKSPVEGGAPIFVRHNPEFLASIRDEGLMKILCRMFRTGPNRHDWEQRYLRRWFIKHEADLDIVVPWEGELRLEVIG